MTDRLYSSAVLDHFREPRNSGELAGADATVEVSNPVCGDVLKLFARARGGKLLEVRFLCRGCTAAIAAGSYLTERLTNLSIGDAMKIEARDVAEGLGGLPPASQHAAALAADAVRALLKALPRGAGAA